MIKIEHSESVDGKQQQVMILRRHEGSVIFAAYRFLFHCNNAFETEIHTMMQDMTLAKQHSKGPIIVQLDSSKDLATLFSSGLARSAY